MVPPEDEPLGEEGTFCFPLLSRESVLQLSARDARDASVTEFH
jgi:hypothetical protein